MKVLVVDSEIPLPLNSGKRIRTYNLLAPLAKDNEIFFLCRSFENIQNDLDRFEECGIKTIVVNDPVRKKDGFGFYAALALNMASRLPYSVTSHCSLTFRKRLAGLLETEHFDLIHCEAVHYLPSIPSSGIPVLVDAHNVEATLWERYYLNEKNPVKKGYTYLQWKKMQSFERSFLARAAHIIAVSENDRTAISKWTGRCSVVENGVDLDYFAPSDREAAPCSLVFCGALDWRPNIDGITWFLENVWPLVIRKYPQTTLTLVGRNPIPALKNVVQSRQGVTLVGTVDDVRPYVQGSAIVVVPLRIGGGSRLKILEAMAMGKPVVSTSVGAEGLEVANEEHILLAEAPTQFAAAIFRLMEDQGLRLRLRLAGRELASKRYGWKRLSERLGVLWSQIGANLPAGY